MTLPAHISDLACLAWPFPQPGNDQSVFTPARVDGGAIVEPGPDYVEVMASRASALSVEPDRMRLSPDTTAACWDAMVYLMRELADSCPDSMALHRDGTEYRWVNRLLGIDEDFLLGNPGTLPEHPLSFVGTQVPVDIRLLTERDGELCIDGAFVASSAASVDVDVADAADLLRPLPTGQMYRRMNWTFPAVDLDDEAQPDDWGSLHLRIELEHLVRLPMTGTPALFSRAYTAALADIADVPEWAVGLADAVEALSEETAASKGIESWRTPVVAWLTSRLADADDVDMEGESAA